MSTRLYTGKRRWRPPANCDCRRADGKPKISYRNEAEALAAADRLDEQFDTALRAYKCPGRDRWHLATRGFHPRALKSHARILAWHISVRRVISWDAILDEFGIPRFDSERTKRQHNVAGKLNKMLKVFSELGLVTFGDPRPSYITAADEDGLRRVMAVGLEEYANEKGVNLR